MSTQYSKLERLLDLLALLLGDRVIPAEEIQRGLAAYSDDRQAFRRTFERDKAELRAMGIPIEVLPVPGVDPPVDGYRIDRRAYAGGNPNLEPDELAALYLAANLVRVQGLAPDAAFWKLGGYPDLEERSGPSTSVEIPGDTRLPVIFEAIAQCRTLQFRYRFPDRVEDRTVDPLQLTFARGHWYLRGHDHDRDDERSFRVDRIEGDVKPVEGSSFERRSGSRPLVLAGWELGDAEPVEARLLVDADQAGWARHLLGADSVVEERPDGSLVFGLTVRNPEGFRSLVLTFLEHAEVLEPRSLRDDLVSWLELVAAGEGAAR